MGLVVGRQNGKGSVLEARELAGLFVFDEQVLIHTAHLQKTATSHFERVLRLLEGVPEFDRRILAAPRGKGAEAIKLRGGQKIYFTTRARGGGRGLSAAFIAYDEAMYLSEQDRSALTPTLAAQSMTGNTQTWYVGSAPDQLDTSQDGVPFAQVRESALAGRRGIAYFEFSAPGDDPARVTGDVACDPEMWALANPGLGIRISPEWVEHERTVEMGARSFAVERLSIGDWPDTSGDSRRVISATIWADLAEHDETNRIVSREAFAIDTNVDQTWASIGVAGERSDGLWQIAVVEHQRGKHWVVDACVLLRGDHPEARFIIDQRGPAANLIPELREAGIEPVEISTQEYGDACADFVADAVERQLRYPEPQPELADSLADARKGPLGDRWKWSRKNSESADISPLVAATLALWGAQNAGSEYTTALFAADSASADDEDEPEIGPKSPKVLSQDETTSCFACRVGSCTVHT